MIAHAPGKVVLSGAYVVLEGAPAIVGAVDRYVVADTERPAELTTREVLEALTRRNVQREHPWFDASALRSPAGDRKLGLGSSAAIVVACLAALELAEQPGLDHPTLAMRVFGPALAAHRAAQRGGSGIDVAASTFGGWQRCQLAPDGLDCAPFTPPRDLAVSVWSSPEASSTPDMLRKVAAWKERAPSDHATLMRELADAAERAVSAAGAHAFVEACRAQLAGLDRLGSATGAPIVTAGNRAFDDAARRQGAVVLPSGAGGGDVVLWIGREGPDDESRNAGLCAGFEPLDLAVGARGVHSSSGALKNPTKEKKQS